MSAETAAMEKPAVEVKPKEHKKRFIYVENMPADAESITVVRKQEPDGLFFSPSHNQFYRKIKTSKGEEKIRQIISTAKGLVHCPDKNKKTICISTRCFRKNWMKDHPDVYVPPVTQVFHGKEGDDLPLDPKEEQELFQDMRNALSNLFDKHAHCYGRFDVLARLLRGLEAEFPKADKSQENSRDLTTDEKSIPDRMATHHDALPDEMKERIQQDEDEIELSDI